MVAPSFQSYKMLTAEPFTKNGKLYVTVEHPNTKNHRDVRWYTEAEYAKAYGRAAANKSKEVDGYAGLKLCRGFTRGPLLLIRNTTSADEAWLGASPARYATDIGWYVASTDSFPVKYPVHFKFLILTWEEFSQDETHAKTPDELKKIIRTKEKNNEYTSLGCSFDS